VDAALGFEGAFDEQLISNKDFAARLGQEARIDSHCQSVLCGAGAQFGFWIRDFGLLKARSHSIQNLESKIQNRFRSTWLTALGS
jgi:hypothetical protein